MGTHAHAVAAFLRRWGIPTISSRSKASGVRVTHPEPDSPHVATVTTQSDTARAAVRAVLTFSPHLVTERQDGVFDVHAATHTTRPPIKPGWLPLLDAARTGLPLTDLTNPGQREQLRALTRHGYLAYDANRRAYHLTPTGSLARTALALRSTVHSDQTEDPT